MGKAFVSGVCFCVTSGAMTLLNKTALSSFPFSLPSTLLAFQCSTALLLSAFLLGRRVFSLHLLDARVLQLWFPVSVLFVGMVWTSFKSLQHLGVGMVTVLKNLTGLLVITGEFFLSNTRYSTGVWITLLLMIISAFCSAATDLSFSWTGYAWQFSNNLFTAGYSLLLRWTMGRMPYDEKKRTRWEKELSLIIYNNYMSVPMILCLAIRGGELARLPHESTLYNPFFLLAACVSAACTFLISFSSMWFLSCTTATIFNIVGSLNKVPLALIGMVAFSSPTTPLHILSVIIGLSAGTVFAKAKATPLPVDKGSPKVQTHT